MSLYQKQLAAFQTFKKALLDHKPAHEEWERFGALCSKIVPTHIRLINDDLSKFEGLPKENLAILDHGAGKGFMVCFLLLKGYKCVKGLDVNHKHSDFYRLANEFFKKLKLVDEDVFFLTDGLLSPFQKETFDYIYSNQVLEHVPDDDLSFLFEEEARVLKHNGFVRHSFPHKNCLNDTHTRTWFLSLLLPRHGFKWVVATYKPQLRKRVYERLFLRSPNTYKRLMRSYFGTVEDETMDRLRLLPDLESYEGNKWLRKQVNTIILAPGIGPAVTYLISAVTIKDLTSRKL